uniref:Alpha-1,3-glucosyltransferase n=1 Tax=Pseudo-nitzschia australis TaxID=44445 RepID=A0A7S4AAV7_9STRA|mmetsp:Transcript_16051/g.34772  ORF Transcript_16051/g.34772 Transcript_16051/m.34772 type:complete len:549 (-) Transcript_16051:139-1785(-)
MAIPQQQRQQQPQTKPAPNSNRNPDGSFKSCSTSFLLLFWGFVTLLRVAIGYQPHSGQDNHHGNLDEGAYGGDFEAQRHWMELTINLPIGDWYWYDTGYWGLDYPPLTAYVSWICGWASYYIVGPESVALYLSRGFEDPNHKAFMRGTVLVLDLLIYGQAVWQSTYEGNRRSLWTILVALCQPAILLIDHGHFQYNTVALGLSIASFSFMVQSEFVACVWGGFFFALALNFKQMTLYYAPVVFFYLLGRCAANHHYRWRWFVPRILWLGGMVSFTFYTLWEPFVKFPPSIQSPTPIPLQRLAHVLRRIFPFERGLFEGKVANLWCVLNTSPVNIRSRIPTDLQPVLALLLTIVLMFPACWKILNVGLDDPVSFTSVKRHWVLLLWAATSCALSFFLASFQVHEKSILLALAPATLIFWEDPIFMEWFSFVCLWSLYPLLQLDRLQVAYWCVGSIFASILSFRHMSQMELKTIFSGSWGFIPKLSYVGMISMHMARFLILPPPNLLDLFDVLWSVAGCGMFSLAWSITVLKLYSSSISGPSTMSKEKDD